MGSILDAFQEGYHPKARPMNTETPTARASASGEEAVAQFMVCLLYTSLFSPFHRLFNWCYGRVSNGYTRMCGSLARKLAISIPLLLLFLSLIHI